MLIFVNDILVYSRTLEEHEDHLHQVLIVLTKSRLHINGKKCFFNQARIEYLGHWISAGGVATDATKINAIQQWQPP